MNILLGYLLTYIYVFLILILLGILKSKKRIKEQTSRKLVHILMGFTWLIMVYFFKNSIHMIILPITMVIFNFLSYKFNIMQSMEQEKKDSKGTIYYAISFVVLACLTYYDNNFLPFYGIGIFTMALGDGFAPLIGRKFNKLKIKNTNKTYAGSFTVMIFTVIIIIIFKSIYQLNLNFIEILLLGLISIPLELLNKKGSNNLTLPLGISLCCYILERWI